MEVITVIEYLSAILLSLYLIAVLVAWVYEIRKNKLYREMQNDLKFLDRLHLSAALNYAKSYKIRHDYLRKVESLERVQKFVLVQMLFMAKNQSKTGKSWL